MFNYKIIIYYLARLAMAGGLAVLVYFTGLIPGCGITPMYSLEQFGCNDIEDGFGSNCSVQEVDDEDGFLGEDGEGDYDEEGDYYEGDGNGEGRGSGRGSRRGGNRRDGNGRGEREGYHAGDGNREGRGSGRGSGRGGNRRDGNGEGHGNGRGEGEGYYAGDGNGEGRGSGRGSGRGGNEREGRRRPQYLEYEYEAPARKVDFLICIDNSSSMAVEHRNIANQFKRFLPAIKDLDYHFAAITSDISSSPNNSNSGAYWQDGKFLPIGRRKWLTNENIGKKPSTQVINDFKSVITREETIECDQGNQDGGHSVNCPSSDERCIYSFNRALRNSAHKGFFRKNSHLILIVLSDEDNRSSQNYIDEMLDFGEDYRYEELDYPETLVSNIFELFKPRNQTSSNISLKKFSFHSIIIPPDDGECLAKQNQNSAGGEGTGRGYYGEEYARLSRGDDDLLSYGNLLEGSVISICRNSYSSQLSKIAVSANKIIIPLPCANPRRTTLYVNNRRAGRASLIEGNTLVTDPGRVPLGARMRMKVKCPKPQDQTEGGMF